MNHALLLDVDGVVLRDRNILKKQQDNVVRYVRKVTRYTPEFSHATTNRLFKKYGHTLLGLRREFSVKDGLHDFNKYIYDDDIMADMEKYLASHNCERIVDDFLSLRTICTLVGVPIYLFSNAPDYWCYPLAGTLNIDTANVICGDALDTLKPQQEAYCRADTIVKNKEKKKLNYIFVDDSQTNLLAIGASSRWTPVYFGGDINTFTQLTGYVGTMAYNAKYTVPSFEHK